MEKQREETVPKIEEELRILRHEAAMRAKNPSENAYLRPSYIGANIKASETSANINKQSMVPLLAAEGFNDLGEDEEAQEI